LKPGSGDMPQSSKAWYLLAIFLPDLLIIKVVNAAICLFTAGMSLRKALFISVLCWNNVTPKKSLFKKLNQRVLIMLK
jgi:hypothetical protein